MVVLLVGIYSEGSVWLVREVRQVLRVLGVGSKTKFWMDCNIIGSIIRLLFYNSSTSIDPCLPRYSLQDPSSILSYLASMDGMCQHDFLIHRSGGQR